MFHNVEVVEPDHEPQVENFPTSPGKVSKTSDFDTELPDSSMRAQQARGPQTDETKRAENYPVAQLVPFAICALFRPLR